MYFSFTLSLDTLIYSCDSKMLKFWLPQYFQYEYDLCLIYNYFFMTSLGTEKFIFFCLS